MKSNETFMFIKHILHYELLMSFCKETLFTRTFVVSDNPSFLVATNSTIAGKELLVQGEHFPMSPFFIYKS